MAGRTPLVLGPTLPALVVFNVLLVVTLLTSDDIGQGLPQLLRYASFAALFVLIAQIVQNRTQVIVLVSVLTGSAALASVVGLGRFFTEVSDRVAGPIADANDFAYLLATVLPLGVYLILRGGRARIVWFLATVVIGVAIVGTLSRGTAVSLVVMALWLMTRASLRSVAATLLVFGVLAAGALAFQRDFIEDRLYTKSVAADESIESRQALWRGALEMAGDHPVLGVGTGQYRFRAAEYVVDDPFDLYQPLAHNAYLEVLAENGVLGLVAFGAYIVGTWLVLRSVRRARADDDDRDAQHLVTALQASFIAAVVGAMFLSVQITPPLWFLGALAVTLDALDKRETPAMATA
jgi:O-antigen ligase